MPVLVDTDVLIDVLRGVPAAVERVTNEHRAGRLYGSVITRAEVIAGMRLGEEGLTREHLRTLSWLPVDRPIADRAGELACRHRRTSPGIELSDYLIAATVEHFGFTLLTRNVKHFPMFKRLRAAY